MTLSMIPSSGSADPTSRGIAPLPAEASVPIRVAIALFPNAEELDWAGPWEVFGYWASRWPDEVQVFTIAETLDPIRCARGLRVLPDRSWNMSPVIDVLVYPGGRGTRGQIHADAIKERLRGLRQGGALLASVCTGALVLAGAGLLDGLAATTHRQALDDLRRLGDRIEVCPDKRFVDAGDVVTAAGVTAGIDMALYLVGRLHSVAPSRSDEPCNTTPSLLFERDRFSGA
jgi:transcriptional regulator GlxA family with amidase domain